MDKKKMKRIPDERMFEVTGGIYQRSPAVNSVMGVQTLGTAAGPNLAEKLPAAAGIPNPADILPAAAGTPNVVDTLDQHTPAKSAGKKETTLI